MTRAKHVIHRPGREAEHAPGDRRDFLVFRLGAEEYGIDIREVREIRGCDALARIASTPACVAGAIELRGGAVPIVDLRVKLGLAGAAYDASTAVVILGLRNRVVGIVVDRIADVLSLAGGDIGPASGPGAAVDAGCITGLGTLGERAILLVDGERLIADVDLAAIDAVLKERAPLPQ
jgi:purine-binding chemotaxis protein CheW